VWLHRQQRWCSAKQHTSLHDTAQHATGSHAAFMALFYQTHLARLPFTQPDTC
jgi:hypothetical protein